MIRVTTLEMTCGACPSQWEGFTDDGRPVYVRYRWGALAVSIGPVGGDLDSVDDGDEVFEHDDGSGFGGYMTLDQLKTLTAGRIEWP